jgi:signal transduction histidine kinase/HAMP domain-containing protein
VHRNLITRLGVATGVVAAIIALVFVLVFDTIRSAHDSARSAEQAEQLADAAEDLDLVVGQVAIGVQALRSQQPPPGLRTARANLPQLSARNERLARGDGASERRTQDIDRRVRAWLASEVDPELRRLRDVTATATPQLRDLHARLQALHADEAAQAVQQRAQSSDAEHRATILAIAGLAGSAALIFLLTAYLAQYIVVPLRRVGSAAQRLAAGDLTARVVEEGDAEPVELARSFNQMAASLEQRSAELARRVRINEAVLDATPDAIGLYAPDGAVVLRNAPMEDLGAGVGLLTDAETRDEVQRDGRLLARFATPVRDNAGDLLGHLVVLRDITAERESERLKDEFFALVSHELRTPLTSILGFLELVLDEDEPLDPGVRRQLEVVHRNARRLLRLVGDMLFVAQAQGGRLTIQRRAVDLGEVAAESVEAARPAAEDARVVLRLHAEPTAPVLGDHDRLGQLLDNLVSNAVKFTPANGDVVVHVGGGDEPGFAAVDVVDTGPGVAADDLAHLFERFYRAPEAAAASVPGMGLGLTIVQTIAEAHGGSVRVASRPGEGLAVHVELPYAAGAGVAGER